MEYRQLGSSDLVVSEIALGTWLTFGGGIDDATAREIVDRSFDLGINFIDTANVYNRGAAETFLGRVLAPRPRDSYILATKLYFPMSRRGSRPLRAQVVKQLDASLARLRTDYVDLYQCHRYDADTPLEETMEALSRGRPGGQGALHRLQRVDAGADPGGARPIRGVERFVSSQPRVLAPAPRAGARCVRRLRRQRHLADRLVAARAGRSHRQVPRRREAAGRFARELRADGLGDRPLSAPMTAQCGRSAAADRRAARHHALPARARVGPARAERCCGDRRRQPRRAARENAAASGLSSTRPRSRRSTMRFRLSSHTSASGALLNLRFAVHVERVGAGATDCDIGAGAAVDRVVPAASEHAVVAAAGAAWCRRLPSRAGDRRRLSRHAATTVVSVMPEQLDGFSLSAVIVVTNRLTVVSREPCCSRSGRARQA